ncbi:cytochrome P450 [Oryctes borbonicus]|uniref:Cytochrome P450 n=1 Tax=Oryctes borbonicus TaxID=1629725 RepID=A0A0T6B4X6_9SCAR|nr:cytochrome P450 [Oryctes borbonicus]
MYLVIVVIVLAVWYCLRYYRWLKNVYFHVEKLNGAPRIPIIGTEYIHIGVPKDELLKRFLRYLEKYGPLARTWNGSQPDVHMTKPEHLQVIMNKYITKGKQYESLHPWLGQGLLTSKGSKWYQHRKLITPTFHFKILENFMPIFVEKTKTLLGILDSKAGGDICNIYPDITHCALDIICETAMGVNVNAMSNDDNKYVKSVYNISEVLLWKALRPYIPYFLFNFMKQGRKFKEALDVLHGFSKDVISKRKKFLKSKINKRKPKDEDVLGGRKRLSFLDMLIEASQDGKVLSDTDIREEVDTFMFEGHDTTTAAMSWALFLLGNHPVVQEKVYDEIRSVLKDKITPTTLVELHRLRYLECVIKEALRLYPSVPVIIRDLEEEIEIDGYKLPPGTQAVLHLHMVQRSPDHFPKPHVFDPDRFLPENCIGRHPYAYVPFSAGPRNCIGQKFAMYEEKTVVASIINRYKLTAIESMREAKLSTDLILKPHNGVLVKLERRE